MAGSVRFGVLVAVVWLAVAGAGAAAAQGGAEAEPAVAQVLADELRERGYSDVSVGWTWLGRLRVVGWIDGREREIIVHPTSGEILRDVMVPVPPATVLADGQDRSGQRDGAAAGVAAAGSAKDPLAPVLMDQAGGLNAAVTP